MICAGIFHFSRGESIVPNIVFGVLAVFIAWGRSHPHGKKIKKKTY
jgi:hypothetical protein